MLFDEVESLVGPWNLEGWSRDGGDFDVRGFIYDVESGLYSGRLDRSVPWYQQLRMDVEVGLYDKTLEAEERYQKALARHLYINRRFCHSRRDRDMLERTFRGHPSIWIFMASLVSMDMPEGQQLIRNAQRVESMLKYFPERGWRHVGNGGVSC